MIRRFWEWSISRQYPDWLRVNRELQRLMLGWSCRKDFSWIQNTLRVEGSLETAHRVDCVFREFQSEEF